jgi:uncharacterized protein YqgV (UPF0045/DUF77 family)
MNTITAQVSLYPLRQVSIEPAIREAVRVFRQHGVETRIGEMSTVVTLSNACPEPSRRACPSPEGP